MDIVLILFGVALVVAVVFAVRQARAEARRLTGGVAHFRQRFEEERQSAALKRPSDPAARPAAPPAPHKDELS